MSESNLTPPPPSSSSSASTSHPPRSASTIHTNTNTSTTPLTPPSTATSSHNHNSSIHTHHRNASTATNATTSTTFAHPSPGIEEISSFPRIYTGGLDAVDPETIVSPVIVASKKEEPKSPVTLREAVELGMPSSGGVYEREHEHGLVGRGGDKDKAEDDCSDDEKDSGEDREDSDDGRGHTPTEMVEYERVDGEDSKFRQVNKQAKWSDVRWT